MKKKSNYKWVRSLFLSLICFVVLTASKADAQTAEEWLAKVDGQMFYKSAEYTALMTVHSPGGANRFFRMNGKVVGDEFALMEYLEPPRQKGTRYLKRSDNLWIYFPKQDRTMHIQGHILRQGVQGGDMSFEDMTESSSLLEKYEVKKTAETDTTITLQLESSDMTVSYPFRELLIDKRNYLPIKMVNSGVNNLPIKELVILKTKRFKNRTFPIVTEIRSRLVENKWTRFEIEEIRFGMKFPDDTFTKKVLEK
ncbi:MAG: outer membrane lipoprotein-sorting protein [Candidatus Hatepunaea meridiana]|nr:outer membrane lipoprotein-sorting protein [Candidatus Hatepunaea meridiana]